MKTIKRIISVVLVVLSVCSMSAFAASRYVVSSVHFRTGAGIQYKSIRVLSKGTKVEKLGPTKKVKTKHATSTWVKVKYKGKTGWICAKYLTSKKPVTKKPEAPEAPETTEQPQL